MFLNMQGKNKHFSKIIPGGFARRNTSQRTSRAFTTGRSTVSTGLISSRIFKKLFPFPIIIYTKSVQKTNISHDIFPSDLNAL